MKLEKILPVCLALFDGEGAAPAAGETGDTKGAVPGRTHRGKSGEYANVKFGKQVEAVTTASDSAADATDNTPAAGEMSEVTVTSNTLEDKKKAYRELVTGEYKDIHTDEMQRVINRRFGETKLLQETLDRQQPLIDMLMQRYKVPGGDIAKLTSAIENDEAYWTAAAEEAGMDVETFREFQKMRRENAALQRAAEDRRLEETRRAQTHSWFMEAQEVAKKFKNFDFSAELENPDFVQMLRRGTPVEHAYKVLHFDELMSDAIGATSAITEKRVADSVRANGSRPSENGTSSQSAFTVKDDVSKLTKKERAEIARRAARGEKIYF